MRINLTFSITGKTKEEVESKLKERVASFLQVDVDTAESLMDTEIFAFCNESEPMDLIFVADCRVKVKNYDA